MPDHADKMGKDQDDTQRAATEPLRLSVVVPTYNRRERLLQMLQALARQTYPAARFEVIVVSDGSTDGTSEAVRALTLPYGFRFVEQTNSGPSVARNRGSQLASAPLIVFVDDDIEPADVFLAEHAQAHEHDADLVLIGPQSGPMQEKMPHWIRWEHQMLDKQYRNFVSGVWQVGPNNLYSGNFSIRREHLLAAGGFNEVFTRQEDVELGFRLAKQGLHFGFCAAAQGIHRPTRSFASWYKTPFEYGRRDVQMARTGEQRAVKLTQESFAERNPLTQTAARICIGHPLLESLAFAALRALIQYGPRAIALRACSLLFNLRYLQGMNCEMGGQQQMWRALQTGDFT